MKPDPCKGHITEAEHLPYMQWHHRAHESNRKGQKQLQCKGCSLWFFPWERRGRKR